MTTQPVPPAAGQAGSGRPVTFSAPLSAVENRREPIARLPGDRILGWVVDCGCALAWVAVTAAVGVPLYVTGVTRLADPVALNVVAAAAVVIPVTVGLAWLESRSVEGTWGKRTRRLAVVTAAGRSRISFARALVRNVSKVMIPWLIGHAAVFSIVEASATGGVPVSVWILTGLAYVLPIVYIVSLFIGSGRTPYDRLAGTVVIRRTAF